MKKCIFTKRSRINAPVEEVFRWHARPGALERLSPPWDPLEVIHQSGGIEKGAKAVMKMKAAPLPLKIKWVADHTEYEENRLFRDRQIKGPFAYWVHTHRFEPDGASACYLEDQIEFALPFAPFGNFFGSSFVTQKLERIFHYRHSAIAGDIADHLSRKDKNPLSILISGAGGLVGSALVPFLTTGGHRVIRLVRKLTVSGKEEVFWDPITGRIDPDEIGKVDAVIHLSGENIGQGRWTKEKKRKIIESRNKSTALLAETIAGLDPSPKVFVSASAVGFYGDRGGEVVTEEDTCGSDFISGVCSEWEQAAAPAVEQGIRVVFLRIGIALSPLGGALERLLLPFKLGLGGKLGSGNQYMSWIGIDDLICIIYYAINNDSLDGPVNAVAPDPVTNLEFTKILGKVLARPTVFSVPETAIKLALGEMGREILLTSTRVKSQKLANSGYRFKNPDLEGALRYLLGR